MIGWLLATAGTAALGSVVPIINIELYLIGVLTTVDGLSWWPMALAATVGQLGGKSLFYLAGRGSFTLGSRLGRMTRAPRGSRWAEWLQRYHRISAERPWWGMGVLFIGAISGLPPFTLMCFVSGAAGIPFLGWLSASLLGRAIHFSLVAWAPELLHQFPGLTG